MRLRRIEFRILIFLAVILLILGSCEIISFRLWSSLDSISKGSTNSNYNTQRFRHPKHSQDGYGYNGKLNTIRQYDLSRFKDSAYMDYTGAGVYRDSQLANAFQQMKNTPFGNTHSNSPASKNSEIEVEKARKLILEWFHTTDEEYDVIFTSGATAALHLVGDSFPWTEKSNFYYLRENHNSVLGIREIALKNGAKFHVVNSTDVNEECELSEESSTKEGEVNNLFAFPLEENFSGKLFPKEWIAKIQGQNHFHCTGNWYVLLDVAAYVPTHDFDISKFPADFVVLSFYKMFGYPTGLGALLVRKESSGVLNKVYYGGGSVLQTVTKSSEHRLPVGITRRFEDGTPDFLGISSIRFGFEAIREVGGITAVNRHTNIVTSYLYNKLIELKHANGNPVVKIYGNHALRDVDTQGPIVTLNVLTPDGGYVPFTDVESNAAKHHIHLRAGWHCNPGAAYAALGLSEDVIAEQIRRHQCIANSCTHQSALTVIKGVMAGGVRISLGYLTTYADCDRVVEFFASEYMK